MNDIQKRYAISQFKCHTCQRRPTAEEQVAMFEDFGHKIVPLKRGEIHLWICQACQEKTEKRYN